MAKSHSIHWRAPVVIVSSFIGACLFALGHHLFNQSLDGKVVTSEEYHVASFQYTSQMANLAVGVLFAFFSRACLVIAVSAAYVQCFWHTVARPGLKARLKTLDNLYSVLGNLWCLMRVDIWVRHPLLWTIAVITWCLPISSVFAPATLTVVAAPVVPALVASIKTPTADFRSLRFLANPQTGYALQVSEDGDWQIDASVYNGPSYMAERIALAVASQGSILPIQAPFSNASWSQNTHLPTLQCGNINDTLRGQMQENIIDAFQGTGCATPYNYLSWTANPGVVPSSSSSIYRSYANNSILPFNDPGNFTGNAWAMNRGTVGPLDWSAVGPQGYANATQVATIYFAVIPNMAFQTVGQCADTVHSFDWSNSTFVQCELHNSTYTANFNYVNGQQNITLQKQTDSVNNPVNTLVGFNAGETGCPTFNADFTNCTVDAGTLERLSYQAVMDAFGRIFAGYVVNPLATRYGQGTVDRTNVMHSVLLDTPELLFLRKQDQWTSNPSNSSTINTLRDQENDRTTMSMKDALELIFQNMTLSMMSSSHFQPDSSSLFAPQNISVTNHAYQNVYAYSAPKLWLAYGPALLAAGLACIVGFISMFINKASYSDSLSTMFRASRGAILSERVEVEHADGKDPLPLYLARANVTFYSVSDDTTSSPLQADEAAAANHGHATQMSINERSKGPKRFPVVNLRSLSRS